MAVKSEGGQDLSPYASPEREGLYSEQLAIIPRIGKVSEAQ